MFFPWISEVYIGLMLFKMFIHTILQYIIHDLQEILFYSNGCWISVNDKWICCTNDELYPIVVMVSSIRVVLIIYYSKLIHHQLTACWELMGVTWAEFYSQSIYDVQSISAFARQPSTVQRSASQNHSNEYFIKMQRFPPSLCAIKYTRCCGDVKEEI